MRRALAVVFVVAALVATFIVGQDRGITLGVEEAMALCWAPPAPGVRVPG
jgi:hypothetical protein